MNRKLFLLLIISSLLLASFSACGRNSDPAFSHPVIIGDPVGSFDVGIAFWPGNEQLQEQVWAGLQLLSAQGVVANLGTRWLGATSLHIPPSQTAVSRLETITPRTLIVGVNPESAPFSFYNEQGELIGLDVDLAQALCTLFGWELVVLPVPWSQREFYLNSGNIDLLLGANLTESVTRRLIYTPPIWENPQVIVTMSDSGIVRLRDTREQGLSVQEGSISEYVAYQNAERLGEIIQYDTQAGLISAFESGRASAILIDLHVANFLLHAR